MVYFKQSHVVLGSILLAAAMTGCVPAHPAPRRVAVRPAPLPPPPPPPPQAKLAKVVVLPLDKAALPDKAEEINTKLAAVRLPGADAPTLATISMETAQLQAECAEPTETCYLKIARLVEADRLLWAQIENAGSKAKKKKGKPAFKLQITLFDRDRLTVVGKQEETFAGAISDEELDKLITAATGVATGNRASTTPPPAAAPPATPPAANPAYGPQPARPAPALAPAPAPAARPVYQPQPAAQPTYSSQPAAAPAPAPYQPAPTAYPPPAAAPAPAAYPPAAAPPAAPPPAARYQ